MNRQAIENLMTRRSVREYQSTPVPEEALDTVLEAGLYAPSAMGLQSVVLVAVQDKATRNQLAEMNAKVMGAVDDPYYGAPAIILVLEQSESGNGVRDGSCALENMLLAAHALGLGSCWINRAQEMFETEAGKALLRQWGLPETLRGVGSLTLGYASAAAPEAAPRASGRVVKIL